MSADSVDLAAVLLTDVWSPSVFRPLTRIFPKRRGKFSSRSGVVMSA